MTSTSSRLSTSSPQTHLHIDLGQDTCPTCGQMISPEKLAEINGRVAAQERELTLAITARLAQEHAAETAAADMRAKAALEAEREQSASREAKAREEALATADKKILEKQSEFENTANERIASIEAAQLKSEADLRARLTQTEATKIAAEEREASLAAQLAATQQTAESQVAKAKEEAAAEVAHIREQANREAEERSRDLILAHETAEAKATARAVEAETKLSGLAGEHAAELQINLATQRETLEKAHQDSINAEKARSFEENQKLYVQVSDLQRALEKKTAEELGEGAEIDLLETLKAEFKGDDIDRVPKGTAGADIIHVVRLKGKACGTIVYDSKNHNQFRNDHVSKLRTDQLAAKADYAILSTRKLPEGTRQIHIQDGVILANPARVLILATILRQQLIRIHTLRLSDVEREKKIAQLYDFITSDRCKNLLSRIDERAEDLLDLQGKEVRWHENNWKKQGEAVRAIQKAKADLENGVDSIIDATED